MEMGETLLLNDGAAFDGTAVSNRCGTLRIVVCATKLKISLLVKWNARFQSKIQRLTLKPCMMQGTTELNGALMELDSSIL